MKLREAIRADLGPIVAAMVRLNENGTEADPRYRLVPDGAARLREHLEHVWFGRFCPFAPCVVAEEGGLAGFVAGEVVPDLGLLANPPTARIDNLWVEPDHRRRGLGRTLVADYSARAEKAGFPRMTVSTLVRDPRAVGFWRAMGFEELTVVLAR